MELSDKEKVTEDQLKAEYICMSKSKLYSEQAGDPQIKNILTWYTSKVQHAETLKSLLEQGGFSPPTPIS